VTTEMPATGGVGRTRRRARDAVSRPFGGASASSASANDLFYAEGHPDRRQSTASSRHGGGVAKAVAVQHLSCSKEGLVGAYLGPAHHNDTTTNGS